MPFDCPTTLDEPTRTVMIWKSERRLGVYDAGTLLSAPATTRGDDPGATADGEVPACWAIGLGGAAEGDKEKVGDMKTPEGVMRVTHRNPQSQFYLSLGLNYPTAAHAEAGFAAGLIDKATRDLVVSANKAGKKPPMNTALGGDIFIHGGGSGADWTWGCIAMDNPVMDWLFANIRPGTRVIILP
jgi:murein L,D-transpeptidase YafK